MATPRYGYIGFDTYIEWPTPELATLISVLGPGRALDIGCGNGTESLFLAMHRWRVVGVDPDSKAIAEAENRRQDLPESAKRRVQFVHGNAWQSRAAKPGTFTLVIDRLVYTNQFRDETDPRDRVSDATYRRRRHRLIDAAAFALSENGYYLMRFGRDDVLPWGRVRGKAISEDYDYIGQFFSLSQAREVGFMSLHTDPHMAEGALVAVPRPQSLLILRRNSIAFERSR